MNQHHVSRPTLLEVGESSNLALRMVDAESNSLHAEHSEWLIESADPSIVAVDGIRLTGIKPGVTEIRAIPKDGDPGSTRSWTIRVMAQANADRKLDLSMRPRLLFSADELSEFKARISRESASGIDFRRLWQSYLRQADEYVLECGFQVTYPSVSDVMDVKLPLKEPAIIPNPDGYVDYPYWTMFSRAVEERMVTLTTAYLVTGEGRMPSG
ncbi:Ig-like domain-containing protein [Paenibacillus puerhi]|uniref:Ig-like domain-containing protein n=1 Tax=Paenibacillus puerhi TaxID=2692622 RepID=UPI00135BFB12|nr:hypothetical protein [Paenibacillus puerhi]